MHKLKLMLATLAAISVAPAAANAQDFLLGLAAGGMLFGGNTQYGAGGATILYSANDDTLKATDPLSMRMAATRSCFHSDYSRNMTGRSLGELFAELTKDMIEKDRTILQIARVFDSGTLQCAAIWFAYIEK